MAQVGQIFIYNVNQISFKGVSLFWDTLYDLYIMLWILWLCLIFSASDWSELSLAGPWLVGRRLYCAACVHWSGLWLTTRQLYRHSQCTYSTSVHTDTPEVPPSLGWRRNFTVSCWVRSLRLHKIGHNTVMNRVRIFWHKHQRCTRGQSKIRNGAAILARASTLQWNI